MRAARTILFFFLPVAAAIVLGILANVGVFRRIDPGLQRVYAYARGEPHLRAA